MNDLLVVLFLPMPIAFILTYLFTFKFLSRTWTRASLGPIVLFILYGFLAFAFDEIVVPFLGLERTQAVFGLGIVIVPFLIGMAAYIVIRSFSASARTSKNLVN